MVFFYRRTEWFAVHRRAGRKYYFPDIVLYHHIQQTQSAGYVIPEITPGVRHGVFHERFAGHMHHRIETILGKDGFKC